MFTWSWNETIQHSCHKFHFNNKFPMCTVKDSSEPMLYHVESGCRLACRQWCSNDVYSGADDILAHVHHDTWTMCKWCACTTHGWRARDARCSTNMTIQQLRHSNRYLHKAEYDLPCWQLFLIWSTLRIRPLKVMTLPKNKWCPFDIGNTVSE